MNAPERDSTKSAIDLIPDGRQTGQVVPAMQANRKFIIFSLCLFLLVGLGWLDFKTGFELNLFIFYSLPVGIAAWYLGLGPGVLMSAASALAWWLADRNAGQKYSSDFVLYWNSAIHVGCFLINAVSIAKTREKVDRQRELEAILREQEAELARLRGKTES